MEIPEGFFNTRYVFTVDSVLDEMGFSVGGQSTPERDATEIAERCSTSFVLALIDLGTGMNASYTFVGTRTTKTVAGLPQTGEWNVNIAGTAGGDGVIVNSALLVRKQTSLGGRKNRGRMFVPPFQQNNADIDTAGNIAGSHVTAVQSQFDEFHTGLVTNEVPPWLLHSSPVDEPTPITAFAVQSLLATQRRRMR